jgi:DNA polymerase (family 10)
LENIDVARIFDEIADILELKDDNRFRIRSYRRAARVVRDMPDDVKSLSEAGQLTSIQGIGSSLAEKIEEILKTGTCKYCEELRQDPVHGLTALLSIPGVGARLARKLNKEIGISGVDELEQAAREGRLRSIEGMGEKIEEKILKGIEQYRRNVGRFKVSEALAHAEAIVKTIGAMKAVSRIDIAGSLRRMKETIGDIDILVIPGSSRRGSSLEESSHGIMDAFTSMDTVSDVLARGETKSSVILSSGIQVDLRILPKSDYGAAMHYFTGSQDHNVVMRDRAKRMGLKISEYGVFGVKDDKRLGGEREEDVFKLVGLPFIPPELRENSGEIEAAEKGELPKLIEAGHIKGDLHLHTSASDGTGSIEEMARQAKKMGYKYAAITDHSQTLRIAGGLNEAELKDHIGAIRSANKKIDGIEILAGIEVDILADGGLDIADEMLAECDVVIAAIHSRFNMPREEMTARIIKAIANPHVNILAHPTGRLINERDPYQVDIEKVIAAAAKHKIALELNAHPDRLDLKDSHCRAAKAAGVRVCIDTDSHADQQMSNMRFGVATARRGWLEPADVINTYPLARLKRFLSGRSK